MSNISPCHEKNAIQSVAFALEFIQEIAVDTLQQAMELHEKDEALRMDLVRVGKQEALNIQINNGVQVAHSELGGVSFESLSDTGNPLWTVQLHKKGIAVICRDYSRWEYVFPQAQAYFSKFLFLVSEMDIGTVALEYVDEFLIDDIKLEWKSELFNDKTKYIVNNIFETDDFWHSHHGFFTTSDKPLDYKVLNSVNIEYVSEVPSNNYKVVIRTQHKSAVKLKIENSKIYEIIESNHALNKSILIDLLSENMLDRIKLKD